MPNDLATDYPLVNREGRRYRLSTTHPDPEGDGTSTCTWDGGTATTWRIPATEGGEAFCSVACLDADTFQCWDHDPGEGPKPEPTGDPGPDDSIFVHNDKHDEVEDPAYALFLAAGGYDTIEDWAKDSDYTLIDGEWFVLNDDAYLNEDGVRQPVDLEGCLEAAIEASATADEDLVEVTDDDDLAEVRRRIAAVLDAANDVIEGK